MGEQKKGGRENMCVAGCEYLIHGFLKITALPEQGLRWSCSAGCFITSIYIIPRVQLDPCWTITGHSATYTELLSLWSDGRQSQQPKKPRFIF